MMTPSDRGQNKSLEAILLLSGSFLRGAGETTGSSGGNKTDFATGRSVATYGGRHTDVLMVTTTMRMLDWVHGNTTDLRPRVPLRLVLKVSPAGFEHGLVDSASPGDDTNHCAVAGRDRLLRPGGKLHFRFILIRIVGDNGGVVSGRSGEFAAVSQFFLELTHDGTLRHGTDRHDVSDSQRRFLSTVDKLSSVHTLDGDERFLSLLEFIGISELNDSQGRSSSGVVNDILDDSLDVSMTFGIIRGAKTSGAFAMFVVRRENRTRTLSLGSNHSTHNDKYSIYLKIKPI